VLDVKREWRGERAASSARPFFLTDYLYAPSLSKKIVLKCSPFCPSRFVGICWDLLGFVGICWELSYAGIVLCILSYISPQYLGDSF
jgi:hypothetical protein